MIRIGIVGNIGSGKSYISKLFGYPVFCADKEVAKLYKANKKCFKKLKKKLPKYITSLPIKKKQILKAITENRSNLKKIIKIVHPEIKVEMNKFVRKNFNRKVIILDIPLLIENKINNKDDILIFVQAKNKEINKRLRKRPNFNAKIMNKFKKLQLPVELKKKKSNYVIKNNFNKKFVKKNVKNILGKILKNARSHT